MAKRFTKSIDKMQVTISICCRSLAEHHTKKMQSNLFILSIIASSTLALHVENLSSKGKQLSLMALDVDKDCGTF